MPAPAATQSNSEAGRIAVWAAGEMLGRPATPTEIVWWAEWRVTQADAPGAPASVPVAGLREGGAMISELLAAARIAGEAHAPVAAEI